MYEATLERARLMLQKFEHAQNELVGREDLAEGLEELLEVRDATSDAKTISICNHLIETYRKKIEDEVTSLIDKKASLSLEFLQHWQNVMAEFQALDIDVPEEFKKLVSQLKIAIVVKQVQQLSPAERERLRILLEQI